MPELAARPIGFFRDCLVHIKGKWAGQPFVLEPWEAAIAANLFGWVIEDSIERDRDGRIVASVRRYQECLIFVPRKNGKSALGAGIGLFVLYCDDEPGAEVYSAAAETTQASLVFNVAKAMVQRNRELAAHAKVLARSIVIEETLSVYKVLSSDAGSKHGLNSHANLIDELHAHKSRELTDTLRTGTGAREQPLTVYLTTSDYEREDSICNEIVDDAIEITKNPESDPRFLPVLYCADEEDDYKDPETWRKANPNVGVSVSMAYLERECARAKRVPAFENTFRRLHLNQRTEQLALFIRLSDWDLCDGDVDEESLEGLPCYVGVDLSAVRDICAVVALFPLEEGRYAVVPRFWAPRQAVDERERKARGQKYAVWERAGLLRVTEGKRLDYEAVEAEIMEFGARFEVLEVGIDPWNSFQTQKNLEAADFEVVQFLQTTPSMNAPTKELDRLVAEQLIAHAGNPILRWMAGNVAVQTDSAGNMRPSKKHSGDKIDGVVALIIALGRALVAGGGGSVYDDGQTLFGGEDEAE